MASSYKEQSVVEAGYATKKGKTEKLLKYKELVNDNYYGVHIFNETMGSWAPDSLEFIKDLRARVSEATKEKHAT